MIKKLIKLANHLDRKGFVREANYLDKIIKMADEPESDPSSVEPGNTMTLIYPKEDPAGLKSLMKALTETHPLVGMAGLKESDAFKKLSESQQDYLFKNILSGSAYALFENNYLGQSEFDKICKKVYQDYR